MSAECGRRRESGVERLWGYSDCSTARGRGVLWGGATDRAVWGAGYLGTNVNEIELASIDGSHVRWHHLHASAGWVACGFRRRGCGQSARRGLRRYLRKRRASRRDEIFAATYNTEWHGAPLLRPSLSARRLCCPMRAVRRTLAPGSTRCMQSAVRAIRDRPVPSTCSFDARTAVQCCRVCHLQLTPRPFVSRP